MPYSGVTAPAQVIHYVSLKITRVIQGPCSPDGRVFPRISAGDFTPLAQFAPRIGGQFDDTGQCENSGKPQCGWL